MTRENDKIDFVVFWVDGNDHVWRAEKKKWAKMLGVEYDHDIDDSDIRYRDWDLLRYWFRGVEQFAPWVNKIHFVTCGHLPKWLNVNHSKLHIVKHSDYMPLDVLPTYNSNAIELRMHKIDGLSEQFVAFNDDFYLTREVDEHDFFKDGKPINAMSLCAVTANSETPYYKTLMNNLEIINRNFNFKQTTQKNLKKYCSISQGKYLIRTLPLLTYEDFPGFANYHMPIAYLKSTFEEVWRKEEDILNNTIHTKFRNYATDVNHWVFNYWQFASGNFCQKSIKFEKNTTIADPDISRIITCGKYKIVGVGDANVMNNNDIKEVLEKSFQKILPNKSEFEL